MANFTPIDDLVQKHKAMKFAVGSPSKEAGPTPVPKEQLSFQEASEHEVVDEDVKPFITPKAESIQLPPDLKLLGLQQVNQTQFPSYKNVKLPLADDKVMQGLQSPPTSSLRWLATLAMYMLQQAHLTLRQVGGKVIRVIKD